MAKTADKKKKSGAKAGDGLGQRISVKGEDISIFSWGGGGGGGGEETFSGG